MTRSHRIRWWELLPEVALLVGLTAFLVDEPDAATSALGSSRALALMAGAALAWAAARAVAALSGRHPAAWTAAFSVAAVGILAVVVAPAYDVDTVVEAPTRGEASPSLRRAGSFRGIDHRAQGRVNLYEDVDGRLTVGLERFEIQPGPDYDVYLVPGADRRGRDGAVRLDDLRGNRGTQFYDVPARVEIGAGPWTLLVWCETFGVPVANATLA